MSLSAEMVESKFNRALSKVVQDGCQGWSLSCQLPSTASPQATSLLFPLSLYCFFTIVRSVIFSSFTMLLLTFSLFLSVSLGLKMSVCFPFCFLYLAKLSFSKALSYFLLSFPYSRGLRYATPSLSNFQNRQGHFVLFRPCTQSLIKNTARLFIVWQ